jgi:hypothetical protein
VSDKEVAKTLLSLAVSLDPTIGQMFAEVRKFSDPEVRSRFDNAVGDLMGLVAKELMFPIVDAYPDLDSDKWTSSGRVAQENEDD